MKKDKEKNQPLSDRSVHRSFQLGALLLIIYISYNIFLEKPVNEDMRGLSDSEINERVEVAMNKIVQKPEYKQVKDFAEYIENNVDKAESKILNVKDGILIYVPQKLLVGKGGKVEVEGAGFKVILNAEKVE